MLSIIFSYIILSTIITLLLLDQIFKRSNNAEYQMLYKNLDTFPIALLISWLVCPFMVIRIASDLIKNNFNADITFTKIANEIDED